MNTSRLEVEQYKKGILAGDRFVLAKAITLIESALPGDRALADELLDAVIAQSGNSLRVGITGAPGVGKSTFIESFGKTLTAARHKIAVLTIDPTSQLTGGSILGDKTRMDELSKDQNAFIRPSPSGHTPGGVAAHTRESILLCEAAGYDIIIVETVGTGQSEYAIKSMVDFFLLLIQPASGDELQGIKKGIVEMADAIAITKADGQNIKAAKSTQGDFLHALHMLQSQPSGWTPKVLMCSALHAIGLREIYEMLLDFQKAMVSSGYLRINRDHQHATWFKEYFQHLLLIDPRRFTQVVTAETTLNRLVATQQLSPRHAAHQLLDAYHAAIRSSK